jgi:hypothetical protein
MCSFRKKFLSSLLFLTISAAGFSQYPTIHSNRPRIFADEARIDWLRANILVAGDCQTTYNSFMTAYNGWWITDPQLYLAGSDSTLWHWEWSSQWAKDEAVFTAFIYKVSLDPLALKRCRFLARQVINTMDTVNFVTMGYWPKEALLRKISDAGDILLDWCNSDFPLLLTQQLAQRVFKGTREFMNTYVLSSSGNSYVSSHNPLNTVHCNQNILALYQAEGITAQQGDTLTQWFQVIYDKWENGFLPCYGYYRDDDGGWNWGAAYAMWSLVDQFQMFENMRVGSSKNYYNDVPWVQNSINQYWYFNQPGNKSLHLGDGQSRRWGDRVDYLHARIYDDPRSLWFAQYWSLPANTPNTIDKYTKLLYKDFLMTPVTRPNQPLDWWSDKVGLSVSRSSWDDDAMVVSFFNSPSKRSDHEHRDNNSFAVHRNTPLFLDAGYYDTYAGVHYKNYYQRTIAHNSICVFDSTENYTNFGQAASNDGGQIESVSLQTYNDIFLPQNQRGHWVMYCTGSGYTYNIADAQLSYNPSKLDFFRRRLLYLRPGKVIVLDHIHLKNVLLNQRDIMWVGHFAKKPTVGGAMIANPVPGHIEVYNGNTCTLLNGTGSIGVKTLLPINTTTTLIGGTGYEYWVNGVNYPPLTAPDTSYYSPGRWRVEIRPIVKKENNVFLHTIATGTETNIAQAAGSGIQSQYSVGADWNDTLYFFAADADTGKVYHVFHEVTGNRTAGIYAFDLQHGAYDIMVDGSLNGTVTTDMNGVVKSSVTLGAGTHTIEITPSTVGLDEFTSHPDISVFPNPANSVITITPPIPSQPCAIEIINYHGITMIATRSLNIDISGLPRGLYLVRVVQGNQSPTARFIRD